MNKNRLIAILSAAVMAGTVLSSLPVSAEEETETFNYENLDYQIADDGHIIITNCYQNEINCVVPEEIDGAPVTEIADSAFSECYFMETLTLPDSIDTIGRQAFSACTALESIDMPAEIKSIGAGAFDGCSAIKEIIMPSGITELPEAAFYECTSLEKVVLQEGVEVLGPESFFGCTALTEPVLPQSLTSIADYAFQGCESLSTIELPVNTVNLGTYIFFECTSLTDIKVAEGNEMFQDIDGVLLTADGDILVRYPEAREDTSYKIPDGCTQIANGSFVDAVHLTSIDLNQATVYGMDVFFRCTGLKEISFPEGTADLGPYMMGYCSSLEKVSLPSTLKTIGDYTFYTCAALEEVTVPEGTESIGAYSFFNCIALKKLSLPDSITEIGDGAFGYYAESDDTEPEKVPGFVVEYKNNREIYNFTKQYELEGTGTYSGRIWMIAGIIAGVVLLIGLIVLIIIRIRNANKIKPVKGGRKGSETKRPQEKTKNKKG